MNESPPSYHSLFSQSKTSPEGVSSDAKTHNSTLKQDSESSVPASHRSSSPGPSPESAQRKVEVLIDAMRVPRNSATPISHPVPPSSDTKPAKASKNQTTRTKRQPQPTNVCPAVDGDKKPAEKTRTKRQPQPTNVSPAVDDPPDARIPLHARSTQHRPLQTSPTVPQKTAGSSSRQFLFTAYIDTVFNIVSYSQALQSPRDCAA